MVLLEIILNPDLSGWQRVSIGVLILQKPKPFETFSDVSFVTLNYLQKQGQIMFFLVFSLVLVLVHFSFDQRKKNNVTRTYLETLRTLHLKIVIERAFKKKWHVRKMGRDRMSRCIILRKAPQDTKSANGKRMN